MKENLNFNNLQELYEEAPNNKRPQDILINGESIFERSKTPAQIEVIKTASRIIKEHLNKLNLEQKPFDEKRIAFLPQKLIMNSGEYHDSDFFALDESTEGNLGTIVHELIHAQSAEWRNYEEDQLEDFLGKSDKGVKSGFHRHSNFKTLNEGITEKIAREIVNNNISEYTRLKPLFEGRMEEVITKEEKRFKDEILPIKIKEQEDKLLDLKKKIEELKKRSAEYAVQLDQDISEAETVEEKNMLLEMKQGLDKGLEKDIENITYISNMFDSLKYAQDMHRLKIEGIKDDYSFNPATMRSYDFNVEMVNNFVNGITKYNQKMNINKNKDKVWEDLQKAYFHGTTVHLRKIDEVFGAGFLRKMDKLSQLLPQNEQAAFLEEMKQKIEQI